MKIFNSINMGEDICIDPGTDFTSIFIAGRGVVLREASVVALNIHNKEIVAVGDDAAKMAGRTPKALQAVYPIRGGMVNDAKLAGELFARLFAKVKKNGLVKPKVMITIPCGISDIEERAVINAVMRAGARQAAVMESPVAAALGAGCDITMARGLMVLDIGSGKTDMAAVSLCNTVVSRSIKTAGGSFTEEVCSYIKRQYSLDVGMDTARTVKEKIAAVTRGISETTEVCGVDISTRLPRKVTVSSDEFENIFDELIKNISTLIKGTLDCVPPEILGDILEDGILMVGGGAKLKGIENRLRLETGVKIFPAEDIERCTIKGAGIAIEHTDSLPNIAQSYHNL